VNCGAAASEKQILCPSRDFAFSHSQGQEATSAGDRTTSAVAPRSDIGDGRCNVGLPGDMGARPPRTLASAWFRA
jgi:hypothetical protein